MSIRNLAAIGNRRFTVTAAVLATAALLCGAAGCVRIDGGAVELSWVLRTPDGRAIDDCSCGVDPVAAVRVELVGVGGDIQGATPCAGRAQCQFSCSRQTGATPFDIPETKSNEMYLISVVALDAGGNPLPNVKTPAPVLRSVVRGQPTDMGALLLVTECGSACSGVNGQGVCKRP
ncbi:MAG TPA: hypothetical protein VNO55_04700 [Polyangia bacterium]|nr:hypothetical protein [Polyangia bacterium]